jgi:hypothetical protein
MDVLLASLLKFFGTYKILYKFILTNIFLPIQTEHPATDRNYNMDSFIQFHVDLVDKILFSQYIGNKTYPSASATPASYITKAIDVAARAAGEAYMQYQITGMHLTPLEQPQNPQQPKPEQSENSEQPVLPEHSAEQLAIVPLSTFMEILDLLTEIGEHTLYGPILRIHPTYVGMYLLLFLLLFIF